jgi:hypothetical protein
MTDPLPLETLLGEFDENYEAWILGDPTTNTYVTIPHPKYPGRQIMHFFMSHDDAMVVLDAIVKAGSQKIERAPVIPMQVKLHEAMRSIAANKRIGFVDGFVVHPPNEVFDTFR